MSILTAGNLQLSHIPIHKAAAAPPPPQSFAHGSFKCTCRKRFGGIHAKKKNSESEVPNPVVVKPTILDEVVVDDEDEVFGVDDNDEDILFDDFEEDGDFLDEDDSSFEELAAENAEVYVGDGAEGGGISLAGTWWDKEVFALAEEVIRSFDGDLGMYAFRTLLNSTIQVRIENLTKKSGSPNMEDIEAFTRTYRAKLDEAELAKSVPDNLYLEVSSPGVERVVRIPHDLERFKERPMYVKYVTETAATGSASESDGIFRLVSYDMETECCTWGLADVRKNREKAGKGRPLSKKQREWRLDTPFETLRLVRIYSEF